MDNNDTLCPFCSAEVASVALIDGWEVLQPCQHPAPVARESLMAQVLRG